MWVPNRRRRRLVGGFGVDRIAVLQAVQRAAGLHRRPQVGGGQRQPRQAERVRRVRLLRRDHAAARPLRAAVVAGERHRAHHAVAIDDRAPHVEIEAAVGLRTRHLERLLEGTMARQQAARTGVVGGRHAARDHTRGHEHARRDRHAGQGHPHALAHHDERSSSNQPWTWGRITSRAGRDASAACRPCWSSPCRFPCGTACAC